MQATSFRSYYFYEVLNSNELVSGDAKTPKLREIGPYVYENKLEKRNLKFSDDGTNLTYTPVFNLYFQRNLSIGNDNETFVFLNLPLIVSSSF